MNRRCSSAVAAAGATVLAGCMAGPGSHTYLLRSASQVPMAPTDDPGVPLLGVDPVRVPDYLDSTDLVLRHGDNRIEPSRSGHWGERLSSGVTEVLEADLARRLPDERVTFARSGSDAARRLRVEIERFDVWRDGRCVLVASWTVRDRSLRETSVSERAAVERPSRGQPKVADIELVAAMDEVLETLAEHIATSIEPESAAATAGPAGR